MLVKREVTKHKDGHTRTLTLRYAGAIVGEFTINSWYPDRYLKQHEHGEFGAKVKAALEAAGVPKYAICELFGR